MVTKLVRQLKNQAKKRSQRKNVVRRKATRLEKEIREKKEAAAANPDMDIVEGDVDVAVNKVGGLNVGGIRGGPKRLSKKQAKRKMKGRERGEATVDRVEKKYFDKLLKVKHRSQIRNDAKYA